MNNDKDITEQQINAFVDNELDTEERELIFNDSDAANNINQQLCEYRKLKELVRHAYSDVPQPYSSQFDYQGKQKPAGTKYSTAAVLMLMSGLIGAVLSYNFAPLNTKFVEAPQSSNINTVDQLNAVNRVILHLESNNIDLMDAALSRAEELIASSPANNPVLVEVVTNDKGLDLLRSDVSPFAERVSNLSRQNVAFIACAKRIENLHQEGIDVTLVPEANSHFTALDRLVDRMQNGWSYEKI